MTSLFPGDMLIGLGFGLGPESDEAWEQYWKDEQASFWADLAKEGNELMYDHNSFVASQGPNLEPPDEDMPEMSIEDGVILKLTDRVQELENKVETLTRTLDIWQEMLGIEVVAVPSVPVFEVVEIHHGICSLCDRQAPLNKQGICEGCSLEAQINHE